MAKRSRIFTSIVYPDSVPDDWLIKLAESTLECYVSPLHDSDLNPTGEKKKPHWHVIICFDSVKSIEQARDFFEKINGVGCDIVLSKRGYLRYFCHLDNPEKCRYSVNDVLSFGGGDYLTLIESSADKLVCMMEIEKFCEMFNVFSYSQLRRLLRNYHFDWYRYVVDNSIAVSSFLKSLQHEKQYPDLFKLSDGAVDYLLNFDKKNRSSKNS